MKPAHEGQTVPPRFEDGVEDGLMVDVEFQSSNSIGSTGNGDWQLVDSLDNALIQENQDKLEGSQPELANPLYPNVAPPPPKVEVGNIPQPGISSNGLETNGAEPAHDTQIALDVSTISGKGQQNYGLGSYLIDANLTQQPAKKPQNPQLQGQVVSQVVPNDQTGNDGQDGRQSGKNGWVFGFQDATSPHQDVSPQHQQVTVSDTVKIENTVPLTNNIESKEAQVQVKNLKGDTVKVENTVPLTNNIGNKKANQIQVENFKGDHVKVESTVPLTSNVGKKEDGQGQVEMVEGDHVKIKSSNQNNNSTLISTPTLDSTQLRPMQVEQSSYSAVQVPQAQTSNSVMLNKTIAGGGIDGAQVEKQDNIVAKELADSAAWNNLQKFVDGRGVGLSSGAIVSQSQGYQNPIDKSETQNLKQQSSSSQLGTNQGFQKEYSPSTESEYTASPKDSPTKQDFPSYKDVAQKGSEVSHPLMDTFYPSSSQTQPEPVSPPSAFFYTTNALNKYVYLHVPQEMLECPDIQVEATAKRFRENKLTPFPFYQHGNCWVSQSIENLKGSSTISIKIVSKPKTIKDRIKDRLVGRVETLIPDITITNRKDYFVFLSQAKDLSLYEREQILISSFDGFIYHLMHLTQSFENLQVVFRKVNELKIAFTAQVGQLPGRRGVIIQNTLENLGRRCLEVQERNPVASMILAYAACLFFRLTPTIPLLSMQASRDILNSFQAFLSVNIKRFESDIQAVFWGYTRQQSALQSLVQHCAASSYQWISQIWALEHVAGNLRFLNFVTMPAEYVPLIANYQEQIEQLISSGDISGNFNVIQHLVLTSPSISCILFLFTKEVIRNSIHTSARLKDEVKKKVSTLVGQSSVDELLQGEQLMQKCGPSVATLRIFREILFMFIEYKYYLENNVEVLYRLLSNPDTFPNGFAEVMEFFTFNKEGWPQLLLNQLFSVYLRYNEGSSDDRWYQIWFNEKCKCAVQSKQRVDAQYCADMLDTLATEVPWLQENNTAIQTQLIFRKCFIAQIKSTNSRIWGLVETWFGLKTRWVKSLVVKTLCAYVEGKDGFQTGIEDIPSAHEALGRLWQDALQPKVFVFESLLTLNQVDTFRKVLRSQEFFPIVQSILGQLNEQIQILNFQFLLDYSDFWIEVLGMQLPTLIQDQTPLAKVKLSVVRNELILDVIRSLKGKCSDIHRLKLSIEQARDMVQPEVRAKLLIYSRHLGLGLTEKHINLLEKYITDFVDNIRNLEAYLRQICETSGAPDLDEYIQPLQQKKQNCDRIIIAESQSEDFWGILQPILEPAREFQQLISSQTFLTLVQTVPRQDLQVQQCQEITDQVSNKWKSLWQVYGDAGEIPVSQVRELWGSNGDIEVDKEFAIVASLIPDHLFGKQIDEHIQNIQIYMQFCQDMNKFNRKSLAQILCDLRDVFQLKLDERFQNNLDTCIDKVNNIDTGDFAIQLFSSLYQRIQTEFVSMHMELLLSLSNGPELISFLREIKDEDVRILNDAVEEHSDSFIREGTVSDFILVKQFLSPFYESTMGLQQFLDKMVQQLLDTKTAKNLNKNQQKIAQMDAGSKSVALAARVHVCNENINGLKRLFKQVANRTEVTRETILNIVEFGSYNFQTDARGQVIEANMVRTNELGHSLTDLQEFRSRALLFVNSNRSTENEEITNAMITYIKRVDVVNKIVGLLQQIGALGHIWYRNYSQIDVLGAELENLQNELQVVLSSWEETTERMLDEFYWLNFFHPEQLWALQDAINTGKIEVFQDLLSSIHMDLAVSVDFWPDVEEFDLEHIGRSLNEIALAASKAGLEPYRLPQNLSHKNAHLGVRNGDVLVAQVTDEGRVIHALMELYSAQEAYPQPGQIMFCTSNTTWYAIQQFLKRAVNSQGTSFEDQLFCMLYIENLCFFVQQQLVEKLFNMDLQQGKIAVLCSKQSYFVDQVGTSSNQQVRQLEGLPNDKLHEILEWFCEYSGTTIRTVTSWSAGMGKTTLIKNQQAPGEQIVSIPINGDINVETMVPYLKNFDAHNATQIHLDITGVNDPREANLFLFRLLFLRSVVSLSDATSLRGRRDWSEEGPSARSDLQFKSPSGNVSVYIEIGNSFRDELQNALTLLNGVPQDLNKRIANIHFEWSLDSLEVEPYTLSDVQVVCNYLDALEKNNINQRDITFGDEESSAQVFSQPECCRLLSRFVRMEEIQHFSFMLLNTFLRIFAVQLKALSQSAFFKVETLDYTQVRNARNMRQLIVESLLLSSWQFTTIFAESARSSQQDQQELMILDEERALNKRVRHMIQWNENSQVQVLFHKDGHCLTALYKDPRTVPVVIKEMVTSQHDRLQDFRSMEHTELLKILCSIVDRKYDPSGRENYVITADNLLKMVLILRRLDSNTPVVLMGETGCGKTSLIKYLADICQVLFWSKCCDAGTEFSDLEKFIQAVQEQSLNTGQEVWAFLDEINTCRFTGVICDLVCHGTFNGRPLQGNVKMIAACNPYRLKTKDEETSGLSVKSKLFQKRRSKLVYSVFPLPETMLNHVWDYGILHDADERAYITSMIGDMIQQYDFKLDIEMLVEIIAASQQFMREKLTEWSVSLRDVRRWIQLCRWFKENLQDRPAPKKAKKFDRWMQQIGQFLRRDMYREQCAVVLALAVVYQLRLSTQQLRDEYTAKILREFEDLDEDGFEQIIQREQDDYIGRMEIPNGIATNQYLKENIFVALVCILTRLPLFIVGKPGSSKSLALQLINSNLRGGDSKDPFFQKLPQVFFISFQGSESSTSEGIKRVFEKAETIGKKANETSEEGTSNAVIPVVVLDEVGLAEISPHNPLKVLHGLLEPGYPQEVPEVAVIGISNWSLDAAKMNRAIVLQRTDPELHDLIFTAQEICKDCRGSCNPRVLSILEKVARAYHYYYEQQQKQHSNFHGLRDFYSLIKTLGRAQEFDSRTLAAAVARNFGGISTQETMNIQAQFSSEVFPEERVQINIDVPALIRQNMGDDMARHLMVVGGNEMLLEVLQDWILQGHQVHRLRGSPFQGDQNDDYYYRILSQVILCMEEGACLVLHGLDSIYGALYDMLNQNYTVVGGKRSCRVALGAHNNSMCAVHNNFRCIVVIDDQDIQNADPPFLNRFEKQHLSFRDFFGEGNKVRQSLEAWVEKFEIPGEEEFIKEDHFVGYGEEMSISLVLAAQVKFHNSFHRQNYSGQNYNQQFQQSLSWCQQQLMKLVPLDALIRAQKSYLASTDIDEFHQWEQVALPATERSLFNVMLKQLQTNTSTKMMVLTFSPIYFDFNLLKSKIREFDNQVQISITKLASFTTEADLENYVESFHRGGDNFLGENRILVVQCDLRLDSELVSVARYTLDRINKQFAQPDGTQKCHVFLLVHITRERGAGQGLGVGYLGGWEYVMIDNLEGWNKEDTLLLTASMSEVLKERTAEQIVQQVLFRAFNILQYPAGMDSIEHVRTAMELILKNNQLLQCLGHRLEQQVASMSENKSWQLAVASNRPKLHLWGSFRNALDATFTQHCASIVSALLYVLESDYILASYPNFSEQHQNLVSEIIQNPEGLSDIGQVLTTIESKQLVVKEQFSLLLPFSATYYSSVESLREFYLEEDLMEMEEEEKEKVILGKLKSRVSEIVLETKIVDVPLQNIKDYFQDFCMLACCQHLPGRLQNFKRVFMQLLTSHYGHLQDFENAEITPDVLHLQWWQNQQIITAWLDLVEIDQQSNDQHDFSPDITIYSVLSDILLQLYSGDINQHNISHAISCLLSVNNLSKDSDILAASQESSSKIYCTQLLNEIMMNVFLKSELESTSTLRTNFAELISQILQLDHNINIFTAPDLLSQILSFCLQLCQSQDTGENLRISATRITCSFLQELLSNNRIDDYLETGALQVIYQCIFNETTAHYMMPAAMALLSSIDQSNNNNTEIQNMFGPYFPLSDALDQFLGSVNSLQSSLLVEALQGYKFDPWLDEKEDNKFQNQDVINMFIQCLNVVIQENEGQPLLIVLCAVACIRSILDELVPAILEGNENLRQIMFQLSTALSSQGQRSIALQFYILKRLYVNGYSMAEIEQFCQDRILDQTLPCLQGIKWNNNERILGVNPFRVREGYQQSNEKLLSMIASANNEQNLDALAQDAQDQHGIDFTLAVLAFSWLQAANRNLTDFEQALLNSTGRAQQGALGILMQQHPWTRNAENVDVEMIKIHAVVTAVSLPGNGNWWLELLQGSVEEIQQLYIPTMPVNEEAEALRALTQNDQFSRFQCNNCRYRFVVGECRRKNQLVVCPGCKNNQIGGAGVNVTRIDEGDFNAAQQQVEKMGYVDELPNADLNKTVRQLTPLAYRILHLVVHSLLYANCMLKNTNFSLPLDNTGTNVQDYLQNHVTKDLQSIIELTDLNFNDAVVLVHAVLQLIWSDPQQAVGDIRSANNRAAQEQNLINLIQQKLRDVNASVNQFMASIGGEERSPAEIQIRELVTYNDNVYNAAVLSNLLRARGLISVDTFKRQFYNYPENIQQYPFIHDVFEKVEDDWNGTIVYTRCLPDIVQWIEIVRSRMQYKITREEAREISIERFIREQHDDDQMQKKYDKFEAAWNECRAKITQYECTQFEEGIPVMEKNRLISYCCYMERDESLYLVALLDKLVKVQNKFIQKSMERAQNGCTDVGRVVMHSDQSMYPSKKLNAIMQGDVIDISIDDGIILLVQKGLVAPGLLHGTGRTISFDFQRIQTKLAQAILQGTVEINKEDQEFVFHKEIFVKSVGMIDDVRKNVKQERLDVPVENIVRKFPNSETSKQVMDDLERIMFFLTNRKVAPNTTIGNLVQAWFPNSLDIKSIQIRAISELPVSQIVSLYQSLEDEMTQKLEDVIPAKLKLPLPQSVENQLSQILVKEFVDEEDDLMMTENIFKIRASALRLVLRKFMFRYLSNSSERFKGNHPIKISLSDSRTTEWPEDSIQTNQSDVYSAVEDNFPEEFLIEHAVSALNFIEERFFPNNKKQQQQQQSQQQQFQSGYTTKAHTKKPLKNRTQPSGRKNRY